MTDVFQSVHELGFIELNKRLSILKGADSAASAVARSGHSLHIQQDGVHFDLTYHPLKYLGRKLITSAFSDALADNGDEPLLSLSLAIPNSVSVNMIEEFMAGVQATAEEYGIGIVSTECTAARHQLCIACAVTWQRRGGAFFAESDAASFPATPTDPSQEMIIGVTGDLGAAFAGLRILLREKRAWVQQAGFDGTQALSAFEPDLEDYRHVVERQLAPTARFDLLDTLRELSLEPLFMAPVRNGIHQDLQLVFEQMGLGGEIHVSALPIDPGTRAVADELMEDVDRYALMGGEDYEMVLALPRAGFDKLAAAFSDLAPIGKVIPGTSGLTLITESSAEPPAGAGPSAS